MDDFLFAIYMVEILSSINVILEFLVMSLLFVALYIYIVYLMSGGSDNYCHIIKSKLYKFTMVFSLIACIVIPSKNTMYVMLALKTTDNIILQSDISKKAMALLENIIDKEIEELENKTQ